MTKPTIKPVGASTQARAEVTLRPSGYMNYRTDASSLVGTICGPGDDDIYHLAITAEDGGRRIGFYALDTAEAIELAKEWNEAHA